jgi:hypothetical protein
MFWCSHKNIKIATRKRPIMRKIEKGELAPVSNSLAQQYVFVDNELQESLKRLKFWRAFSRHGVSEKRTGYPVRQIVFTLLVWVFLKKDSIRSFLGSLVGNFFLGGKDVLYDFLKREDINWRRLSMCTAKEIYVGRNLAFEHETAFVVDDSIKKRSGKKVEGVSKHFEHSEGRCVMGQQIVQLGFSWPDGYIPLDNQIYIGDKKVHPLTSEFADGRSAVAKDYDVALNKNKHEQLELMLRRVILLGIAAKYLLGDSWYGCRKNVKLAIDLGLVAIFRMKRGNLKYRLNGKDYTLTKLYYLIKRRLEKKRNCKWKSTGLTVEINLSDDENKPEWIKVRLVFSCPKNPKKDEWAAFLCSDIEMTNEKVLETYAMRWGIEVYFKEAKQHMGFLKEQTGNYACHYASIHLTSIRYLLLFDSMKERGADVFGQVRNDITGKMELISLATLLWDLFKTLIYGVLDQFKTIGKEVLEEIKETMQTTVEKFLEEALQLDSVYLKNERKAEKLRALV